MKQDRAQLPHSPNSNSTEQSDWGHSHHRHTVPLCSYILHCLHSRQQLRLSFLPRRGDSWYLSHHPLVLMSLSYLGLPHSVFMVEQLTNPMRFSGVNTVFLKSLFFFLYHPQFGSYLTGCLHHHLFKTFLQLCQGPLSFICFHCSLLLVVQYLRSFPVEANFVISAADLTEDE